MREIWKKVVGYEGLYEVSNLGRVWSCKRRKVMSPNNSAYPRLVLCKGKVHTGKDVHVIVANAFIGPCPKGKEVNHKDLNTRNSKAKNLEYVTSAQNKKHARDNG